MEPVNKPSGRLLRRPLPPKPPPQQTDARSTSYQTPVNGVLHANNPQFASYPTPSISDLETPVSSSPPPPTEIHSRPQSEALGRSGLSTRKSQRSLRRKENGKYLMDPNCRERTSIGTYVEGNTLVKPYRPRGPAGLPCREPKHNPPLALVSLDLDEERYYETPAFTLQDFTLKVSQKAKVPLEKVQTAIFSRHTYKKLQSLLVERCIPKYSEMTTVQLELPDDIPNVSPRIPHQQLLLEMATLVKEQMAGVIHTDMKAIIRPMARFSPDYKPGVGNPHTEILLYEDHSRDRQKALTALTQEGEVPGHENIFHGGPTRYFQGSRRSNSPFATVDESLITPSELAVLDSIMNGAVALSLKAHFISQLPDIEPLSRTVTYLNLSFNDFREIPMEVFNITQLTVLKLRNNPIKEITAEISLLKNLKTLIVSFCLLSSLPLELFNLVTLDHLDIAYNKISVLPVEFRRLKRLRVLNVEGNQLPALPAGALRLPRLKQVRLRNNFMHPLFWQENTANQPQRLVDMSALMLTQTGLVKQYNNLPDHIISFLQRHSKCDLCRGPMFGQGLRTIRPVSKIFNIKNVPFLFHCCSNHCLQMFANNPDGLMDMLYGRATGHQSS